MKIVLAQKLNNDNLLSMGNYMISQGNPKSYAVTIFENIIFYLYFMLYISQDAGHTNTTND